MLKTENLKLKTAPGFVFFGTPELTIQILEELKSAGMTPSLIVTSPDKPRGRGLSLTPPPVKIWAEQNNIPVLQPVKLDSEFSHRLLVVGCELFIVVAYGKIIPQSIIDLPKYGVFNVHYSLLPKYRGATPVESAILNGDKETGVVIQKMVFELDAGAIVAEEKVVILENENTSSLRNRLNEIAKKMLVKTISKIIDGTATYREQNPTKVTSTKKINKEDGLIDQNDEPLNNYRKFLALQPWPGIYFFAKRKNGDLVRVSVKDCALKNGEFIIKRVLPEGKKEMDYKDFLRGL